MDEERTKQQQDEPEPEPEVKEPEPEPEETPEGEKPKDDFWKNRFHEYKRVTEEQIQELKAKVESLATQKEPDDEFVKEQKRLAREQAEEILYRERFADQQMERILEELETKDDLVKKFRSEIRRELQILKPEYRANSVTVQRVIDAVIGRNRNKIFGSQKTVDKKLSDVQPQTLESKPSPEPSKVVLTKEEEEYKEDKQLYNFTDEEVKEMYQKDQKRKEKLAEKKKTKK